MLPDMSAKVSFLSRELTSGELKPRLAVNERALAGDGGKNVVYLIKNDKAHRTIVERGGQLGDMQEVLTGLQPGDRVVLSPQGLKDGSRIKVAER